MFFLKPSAWADDTPRLPQAVSLSVAGKTLVRPARMPELPRPDG